MKKWGTYLLCVAAGFGCASAGLLCCTLNEWVTERFFPWDGSAWYLPVSQLFDWMDDVYWAMIISAFVGYALALVCEGRYKGHMPSDGADRFGMAKFRLLFGLGVAFFGGIFLFLSEVTTGWDSFGWWAVFLIILFSWTAVLLYALLAFAAERLMRLLRGDDSCRISPIWKTLGSLPFFIAVFAAWYWIEMR